MPGQAIPVRRALQEEERAQNDRGHVAPGAYTDVLLRELEELEYLINLSVVRGASIKPSGDVVTVHVLNRGADGGLRLANAARKQGHVSVITAELSSIIDPEYERKVANDVDEALWEETETGLRHQSQIMANYLALMALGGAVAATGLVVESTPQAISVVAESIIAPGFEPLAKITLGLVLRR